ncbi:MAG: hypothetical protein QOI37_557, partial [Chloroflexota bacterium]|nr:hypothetical protein [Chloroflexota bacterium]
MTDAETDADRPAERAASLATVGPAEPRLLALRLQGFKSFAERTIVE